MKKPLLGHRWLIRLCTGLGYVSILFQWMFTCMIYLSVASHYGWLQRIAPPSSETPALTPQPIPDGTTGLGFFELLTAIVVVVGIGAVMVYAVRHLPSTIIRGGDKLTHKPAQALAPVLLNHSHKPVTTKRRLQLTARLVVAIKGLLIVLPLLLLTPLYLFEYHPLESHVLWTVAAFGAITSIVWFTLEQLLGRLLGVTAEKVD